MRIAVIGGGPGALYFSRLMRLRRPGWDVIVYERNPADATFGFGVGFGGPAMPALERADGGIYADILRAGLTGSGMQMRNRGSVVRWPGFDVLTISRRRLLGILQEHAGTAGVDLRFREEVDPDGLGQFDLIVAADGAGSAVRRRYAEHFGTTEAVGEAKYIWLGTRMKFPTASFSFRQTEVGTFALHAYPYETETSTVVAETDEETWRRAGLDCFDPEVNRPGMSDLKAAAYLEKVFEEDLEGHELLVNNSKWLNFRTIRNRRWHHGNVVLLGDAAHTAHYSIGSGTRMAMEDAIELAAALDEHSEDVSRALSAYEDRRRPHVEHLQARSDPSMVWWETFGRRMEMDAEQLFFSYVTRTGALSYEKVRDQSPSYVASVMECFVAHSIGRSTVRTLPARPIEAPLKIRDLTLPNRIVTDATDGRAHRAAADDGLNPSIVMAQNPDVPAPDPGSNTLAGLRTHVGALPEDGPSAMRGFELVELTGDDPEELNALLDRIRLLKAQSEPPLVSARLPAGLHGLASEEAAMLSARTLKEAGCDLVRLPRPARDQHDAARLLLLSERIRLELGLSTIVEWPPESAGDADTAILSGQADLVDFGEAPPTLDHFDVNVNNTTQ